jgi:hypothetical protein
MKVSPQFLLTASVALISATAIAQLATINNAIASLTAPPSNGMYLDVRNMCNRPIRLSVLYSHPNIGNAVEEGWYAIPPNKFSHLKSNIRDGGIFIRKGTFSYYYAETTDGSRITWGQGRPVYFIKRQALRLSNGARVPYSPVDSSIIALTCPST